MSGNGALSTSLSQQGGNGSGVPNKATESFTSQNAAGKVDILFVDDNSASMEIEQNSLGARFSALAGAIAGLDWQVGITTTDCSAGTFGICGDLLPLTGGSGRILKPTTANYATVFRDTVVRPETVDCVARGICPSGNEEPLKASMSAMDKRNGVNRGFFRANAALAIVILTDEDEQSDGPPTATKPQAVIDHFSTVFGAKKILRTYAITILAGDAACLTIQQNQQGGIGSYGTFPIELARLTGGISESICSANYATLLNTIGANVQDTVTEQVSVAHLPIAGSVKVTFTPKGTIGWTVQDRNIIFNSPIPVGTVINVSYEY